MADALNEIASIRLLAGLSLDGAITDHITTMNFRYLLERYGVARKIFSVVSYWLSETCVLVKEGALMDAIHY